MLYYGTDPESYITKYTLVSLTGILRCQVIACAREASLAVNEHNRHTPQTLR